MKGAATTESGATAPWFECKVVREGKMETEKRRRRKRVGERHEQCSLFEPHVHLEKVITFFVVQLIPRLVQRLSDLDLLLPSCAACGMGLLSFCLGSSSVAVQPEGTALAPGVRGNEMRVLGPPSVENADSLVSLLTQAQQMELQAGFRQFDVNGNGTMCAAHGHRRTVAASAPPHHSPSKDCLHANGGFAVLSAMLSPSARAPLDSRTHLQ